MKKITFTILGDSISMGYSRFIEKYLAENFVFLPKTQGKEAYENLDIPTGANCGDSRMLYDYIKTTYEKGNLTQDLLIINAGLHDIKTDLKTEMRQVSEEEYVANLDKIFTLLKSESLKILFINTTKVADNIHNSISKEFFRYNRDVLKCNTAASELCKKHGIPMLDLYSFTEKFGDEAFMDHVHYPESICEEQAKFIASEIKKINLN